MIEGPPDIYLLNVMGERDPADDAKCKRNGKDEETLSNHLCPGVGETFDQLYKQCEWNSGMMDRAMQHLITAIASKLLDTRMHWKRRSRDLQKSILKQALRGHQADVGATKRNYLGKRDTLLHKGKKPYGIRPD